MKRLWDYLKPEIRSNPEFQSAVVRLGVWLFSAGYLGLAAYTGYYQVDIPYFAALFTAYLLVFLGLALSVLRRPWWLWRRYLALAADVSGVSLAIFLTREAISPFYLLYIWIFISYGTRYGKTHLKWASALSVLAYNLVLLALDQWRAHTFEAFFFLLLLVLLPLYQYSLLRRVQEARQEAERANQAKSDFLSTMTHELRTPLSGVLGMTRLLESTRLTPEQRDYVHSVSTSAQVLRALIGDILDLSKIEARKLHLESVPFDLRPVLLEVCHAFGSQALDKGLELVCRVDTRLPQILVGDPLRLRQILFNLVGNAIKFTERGEVVVTAQAAEPDGDIPAPHLYLEVRDTGVGIAPDKLLRIFDSFWQADDSTTRRYGGTGLGTTIARNLAHLMGGGIGVESREGEGSLFWVRLPLLPDGVSPRPPPDEALQGRRVLVYEANLASRQVVGDACELLGISWQALENLGQLGALSARGAPVDLVVIADSPAGEDLDGLRSLLNRALGRAVPVVLLTYQGRRRDPDRSCRHCLNKPFVAEDLADTLRAVLAREPLREALPLDATQEQDVSAPASGLRILVAEDDAIAAKVITAFLEQQGHRVVLTRNGEETLGLARAETFDMAFVDLRMPRIDGLDFTRTFRAAETAGRRLPIIALTANAAEDIRQECLEAGMDDFLAKPVDPERLREVIGRLCPRPG